MFVVVLYDINVLFFIFAVPKAVIFGFLGVQAGVGGGSSLGKRESHHQRGNILAPGWGLCFPPLKGIHAGERGGEL